MSDIEDGDEDSVWYGSAESNVTDEPRQAGRTFVLQRGLWVPKDYVQAVRPIGFVWE